MDKINKDFDGVSWEWTGTTTIRALKPICPKEDCKNEMDIIMMGGSLQVSNNKDERRVSLTMTNDTPHYLCSRCSFEQATTITLKDNSTKALRKAARKEFERRQRLMERKTT